MKNTFTPPPSPLIAPFCGQLPQIYKANMAHRLAQHRVARFGTGNVEDILVATLPIWVHKGDPGYILEERSGNCEDGLAASTWGPGALGHASRWPGRRDPYIPLSSFNSGSSIVVPANNQGVGEARVVRRAKIPSATRQPLLSTSPLTDQVPYDPPNLEMTNAEAPSDLVVAGPQEDVNLADAMD
jgi:hypothetical protein